MANKQKRKGQAAPVHTAGGRMAKIVFGLLSDLYCKVH